MNKNDLKNISDDVLQLLTDTLISNIGIYEYLMKHNVDVSKELTYMRETFRSLREEDIFRKM